MYILPGQTRDVGEILDTEHAVQKVEKRKILLILLRSIAFLARQGLALRGYGKEVDSNFRQLLLLQATENKKITEWLSKPTNTFTSKDIQNEMLKLMAVKLLGDLTKRIQKVKFFYINGR